MSSDSEARSEARLRRAIITCERCPRLIHHCRKIAKEKKKAHLNETYWGRPVPNFGQTPAALLIVGLAPAAHGANRTGRMFTGDRSGQWLYRALHRAGFANQSSFERADDGLELIDAVITAVAHCAPPDNKPLPDEIANCSEYLERTFALQKPRVVLALGGIAWTATLAHYKRLGHKISSKVKFGHGAEMELPDGIRLIGSYHPSQQNTFTGRLTEEMFDEVFRKIRSRLK
jgi:uracil-DNA glycosylase family 4